MNLVKQKEVKMDTEVQENNFYNKVLIDWFDKNPKYTNILKNRIMNEYIKQLIEVNKDAVESIADLENVVKGFKVVDEKSKVTFGNLCILLNGYRNIANATECLLSNEDVIADENGEYYQKIKDEPIVPPTVEGAGNDFDKDKKK